MMKKMLCLLLCVMMVAALFVGCAPSESGNGGSKTGALQAGYGRVDVTPDENSSMPLSGLGGERNSMGVLDQLYITCVAVKDEEGNTFLLYHCDFLKAYSTLTMSKRQIAAETGVPQSNIVVATTHNHSSIGLDDSDSPLVKDYQNVCREAMVAAGKAAVEDLKPAKMYVTSKKCEKMTYVRHYERPNGTVHGSGGSLSELYVGYAAEVDDNMELIKFVREGGKDIVMMNWQGHPRGHSASDDAYSPSGDEANRFMILSDVDIIRKTVETGLDCHFAYYLGASGNVNNSSAILEDRITKNYVEHGQKLGALAIEAAANFTEVQGGAIKKVTTKVSAEMKEGNGSDDLAISALSIGNAAVFIIAPYEMFSGSALDLKEYSKFDLTYIVTCADSAYGYIPTEDTFDTARYKTTAYEVNETNYAVGTAEKLVEAYKGLMDQLYTK